MNHKKNFFCYSSYFDIWHRQNFNTEIVTTGNRLTGTLVIT